MQTKIPTQNPLMDMTDEDILKVVSELLDNFEDGGLVFWVALPNRVYGMCDYPECKALKLSYSRVYSVGFYGLGYVLDLSGNLRDQLADMERLAEHAHMKDGITYIEPLGSVKNDVIFGNTKFIEVM